VLYLITDPVHFMPYVIENTEKIVLCPYIFLIHREKGSEKVSKNDFSFFPKSQYHINNLYDYDDVE
jgi:hypothetical protein